MSSIRIFLMMKAANTEGVNQSFQGVKKELHLQGELIPGIIGETDGGLLPHQRNRIDRTSAGVGIAGVAGNL